MTSFILECRKNKSIYQRSNKKWKRFQTSQNQKVFYNIFYLKKRCEKLNFDASRCLNIMINLLRTSKQIIKQILISFCNNQLLQMNKFIIVSLILIVFANSQLIELQENSLKGASSPGDARTPSYPTVLSYIYQGIVNIEVSSNEQSNINFYVQLVQYNCSSSWVKCFNGWVLNYTQNGENPVIGSNNTLVQSPIFKFNTNSENDYEIVRSKTLDQIWVQIIELTCQKFNPQLIKNSFFDSSTPNEETSTLRSSINSSNQNFSSEKSGKCILTPRGISQESNTDPNCISFLLKICLKCSTQYYLNSSGKCVPVSPLCKSHDNSGSCTSCYSGFNLAAGSCVLQNKDVNCISKDSNGFCNGCANGYYLNKATGLCTQFNPLCKQVDLTTGNCTSCYLGYTWSNGDCIAFFRQSNCLSFDFQNICLQCTSSFYLDQFKKCQPLNPLCQTHNLLNGDCLTCFPGYTLQGRQCLVFQNPFKVNDSSNPNCKTFSNGFCSQCIQGYILTCDTDYSLINEVCVVAGCKIQDLISHQCLQCSDGWLFNQKGICYLPTQSQNYGFKPVNNEANPVGNAPLRQTFSKVNSSFTILKASKGDQQALESKNLTVDKLSFNKSVLVQNILLDSNLMVKQRLLTFDYSLKSNSSQGLLPPDLTGKFAVGLKQAWKGDLILPYYEPTVSKLNYLISSPDNLAIKVSAKDIQNNRTNFGQTLLNNEIKNDPPVISENITTQNPENIDVVKLFDEDPATVAAAKSYLKIDSGSIGGSTTNTNPADPVNPVDFDLIKILNQIGYTNNDNTGVAGPNPFYGINPTYSGISQNPKYEAALPLQNVKRSSSINKQETIPSSQDNLIEQHPKGRLLQQLASYGIYNDEKLLIYQYILGYPMFIKLKLKCDLVVYWNVKTICYLLQRVQKTFLSVFKVQKKILSLTLVSSYSISVIKFIQFFWLFPKFHKIFSFLSNLSAFQFSQDLFVCLQIVIYKLQKFF